MSANVADPVSATPSVEFTLPIDRYHAAYLEVYARIYTAVGCFNLFRDGDEKKEANA